MPDAVVDYDLLSGKWNIIQQQNLLHERTKILYGKASTPLSDRLPSSICFDSENNKSSTNENPWNDLSEFYACEHHNVPSHDGVMIPLTIVYAKRNKKEIESPVLLHGHGAYGELLDKRWRSELKSLLDRGWLIAYADVRYLDTLVKLPRFFILLTQCVRQVNTSIFFVSFQRWRWSR